MLDRHFCVTVYVFDKEESAFLMLYHKKLKKWLPPGGHIENNETPEDAAKRECLEETGISIELLGKKNPYAESMIKPLGIQLNVISEGEHEHMDILYLARPTHKNIKINYEEAENVYWIPIKKIINPEFDTFPSIQYWCERLYSEYELFL